MTRNYIGMAVLVYYVMSSTRSAGLLHSNSAMSPSTTALITERIARLRQYGRLGQFGPNLGWILKQSRHRHSYIVPWPQCSCKCFWDRQTLWAPFVEAASRSHVLRLIGAWDVDQVEESSVHIGTNQFHIATLPTKRNVPTKQVEYFWN